MTEEEPPGCTCPECGSVLVSTERPCPRCGSDRRNVCVAIQGVAMMAVVGNVGTVADSPARPGRPHSITVQTPLGARSEARHVPGAEVTLAASGRPDVGTRGEPQVRDILRARLVADGLLVEVLPGAIDRRGEDGLWQVAGQHCFLQVTSVPRSAEYWRDSAQGSATTRVTPDEAIGWIRSAVEAKAVLAGRDCVILAIDARHAGVLADPGLADEYRNRYSSPADEFGFSSAWIVGPTPRHCVRL